MNLFSHLDENGQASMVDIGAKDITRRFAVASGSIAMSGECFSLLIDGRMPKGDVFSTARIAGIQAAKRTSELIPLCHALMLEKVSIDFASDDKTNTVEVRLSGKTGAEMEALTGASVALLTVYDMCKAVDRSMVISGIRLIEKDGGKTGHYLRNEG